MKKIILFLAITVGLFLFGTVNVFATDFNYTGGQQTWTVPAGAIGVTIECWGAGGGGGYSKGDLAAAPGQTLYIYVGGQPSGQIGGWNGGGNGGNGTVTGPGLGGYGATDVRFGGTALANRIIVAGGAGGWGGSGGDYGGGITGGNSSYSAAGSQTNGYALGQGGPGADEQPDLESAASNGGGGGYYGGFGGGGYADGGAGGSGYIGGVTNGITIAGNASFPAPGGGNETGHWSNGLVRITAIFPNQNPVISLSTPTTDQTFSAQIGYKTITITGEVSDPDANNVTVSATIGGVTKSTTVNSAPTTLPGSPNFTLTWDVTTDNIAENTYSNISVGADDGAGGTANATLAPTITVDKTAPTVNAPTSTSVLATSITVQASAVDTASPLQYLFNIGGVDQGTWQSGNSYTFTGLTQGTAYVIKYKAQDAVGNISAYSAVLNVTTIAPPPTIPSITTVTGALSDTANNGDGRDIRVTFKGASSEVNTKEYRIIAVRTTIAGTFDADTASALASGRYIVEPVKGKLRTHLLTLTQATLNSEGNTIVNGTNYTVYVLAVAKTGYSNALTSVGTITLSPNVPYTRISVPLVRDTANNGDGRDIIVTLRKPVEKDILSYKIFVWDTSTASFGLAEANTNVNGYTVAVGSGTKYGYTVRLPQTQKDTTGAPIQNGKTYKIYILAVKNTPSTDNILSAASRALTLSQYYPAVSSIRTFSIAKVGSGHDSSNISVSFSEPFLITNVQEYRIFISPALNTLDLSTADGSTNYQVVNVSSSGALHTVTLNSGLKTYDGSTLASGDYKVYVLIVGKNSYANRLSIASKIVTLD